MCSLLTEIRLTETRLYNHRETNVEISNEVMKNRTLETYVPIFKKYGINYAQYQKLLTYYMGHPRDLEEIMQEVAENLTAMEEGFESQNKQE